IMILLGLLVLIAGTGINAGAFGSTPNKDVKAEDGQVDEGGASMDEEGDDEGSMEGEESGETDEEGEESEE
ncbi:hypothetical protein JW933_05060, partial [candidate division FCPU426 bacterium]|nr:hypothetical protein [candidate division FCPU426 bacterium]